MTLHSLQLPVHHEDDIDAVVAVLRSDFLTQGPSVPALRGCVRGAARGAHAVAVSNATAGLHMACLALGVGPGKRVWTSPNSFLASANCALYCGADVDFVDIDPARATCRSRRCATSSRRAERRRRLPHVVIPVDFAGLPCDLRGDRARLPTATASRSSRTPRTPPAPRTCGSPVGSASPTPRCSASTPSRSSPPPKAAS